MIGRHPVAWEPSHVPKSDAVAEVVEVGEGVIAFAPDDRVISLFHPRGLRILFSASRRRTSSLRLFVDRVIDASG